MDCDWKCGGRLGDVELFEEVIVLKKCDQLDNAVDLRKMINLMTWSCRLDGTFDLRK